MGENDVAQMCTFTWIYRQECDVCIQHARILPFVGLWQTHLLCTHQNTRQHHPVCNLME